MPDGTLLNRTVARYRLVDFIGAGGMGEVYRAVDLSTGHVVAMKVLGHAADGTRWVDRFYNEARLQAALRHPNVAAFHECIEFQKRPCIVMEYVEGQTLAERVRARGSLPVEEAAALLAAVTHALAYVHERGIVHRDIKPTNIKITPSGVVKLLDFGIAKAASLPGLTQTGNIIGTPLYLSPEQMLGGEATPRSDIWALGIVFYELLTGRVPFQGQTITEVWQRVTTGSYSPASDIRATGDAGRRVLRRADKVIARCLQRDPSGRYQSAEELAGALEAFVPAAAPTVLEPTPRSSTAPVPLSLAGAMSRTDAAWRSALSFVERFWIWMAAVAGVALIAMLVVVLWPSQGGRNGTDTTIDGGVRHRLTIDVYQGKAEVFINGRSLGRTPYAYDGRLGEIIELELRQPGFLPMKRRVELTQQPSYTFDMERARQ